MFDILGIDWGEKYFGIAFANYHTGLILPSKKVHLADRIWQDIEEIIANKKIKKVVIGLALNFNLEPIANTQKILDFKDKLYNDIISKNPEIEVFLFNERGSNPKKEQENTILIHNLAAQKILEWWIQSQKHV